MEGLNEPSDTQVNTNEGFFKYVFNSSLFKHR